MKPNLPSFIFALLVLFTFYTGDLKANPDRTDRITSTECSDLPYAVSMPAIDDQCYPPGWTNTYNVCQTTATWQWDTCNGATGYNIQWRYPNGSWCNIPGMCYQSWVNVSNLQPCTSYEWRVRSYCSSGYYSSWCYPCPFTTICNTCVTPYGCYSDNITDHSANFHWDEVYGAQNYCVQYRSAYGSWTYLPDSPCNNNFITCYNLDPSSNYQWRVRSYCGYGNYSDWTYYNYFTTGSYCHSPDWLSCYNITECCATWKWATCNGADYYWVQWRHQGGSWYDLPGGGACYGTWVNVNCLQPCSSYEYRVKSHCYSGWSDWCNSYGFSTICNNCSAPYGLLTKDIGDKQATLKWSPVSGAYSYTAQILDSYGNWHDVTGCPTSGTWIIAYNLVPCKSYQWRVRANCGNYDSFSYWSGTLTFTTTCGNGCNTPSWVYTSGITSTSGTLHWAPVSGADYYVVQWRAAGGTWYELQGGPWTNPWTDLTGLQSNANYEWQVKCHCPDGHTSDWSSITYFKTLGSSCGMPFYRYTLPITDSTATFNWSSVSGALNYTVQIKLLNGLWVDVPGSPTTDSSITVIGLVPDTLYSWRMQVNCSNGAYSSWLSSIDFHTGLNSGCNTPGSRNVDSLTLTSAALSWAPVQGAVTYSVQIKLLPQGAWNAVSGSPFSTNSVLVTGLSPYTTYAWRVKSNCTGGFHSFWSNPVQFTTANAPSCHSPGNLTVNPITETTASLHWSSVYGSLGYQVQTRLPNGVWIDIPGIVADSTLLATGFTPHTTYEWHVRAQCHDSSYSNWSSTSVFTTIGTGVINDDCASAMLLTVETSCVSTFASNIDATASLPAPVGGCSPNGYKDVWFKFTMPDVANPAVTIRTSAGSLADAVMEVYTGNDCNIQSIVTCEDNNDNGNGSSMPVINLTGTPNATIWVRVWGLGGSTGTFTICVFNYISFNYAGAPNTDAPDEGVQLSDPAKVVQPVTESGDLPAIQISPNPVSDQLNVVVRQTKESRIIGMRFLDFSGKVVYAQEVEPVIESQFRSTVGVSNFVPGMYFLQVQTTRGMMTEKVMVVK